MHPEIVHALARQTQDEARARADRARSHARATPRRHALRRAVGYRLVITGWRLLDPAVTAAAAPPARTAGPRPA